MRRLIILLLFPWFVAFAPAASVTENVVRTPYTVSGNTNAEVRADIDTKRPNGWDAYTTWNVNWRYWYRVSDAGCAIDRIEVDLKIVFTMPKLVTSNAEVRKSFDAYIAKLQIHEDGHADVGRHVARKIQTTVAMMTAPNCDELGQKVNAEGTTIAREGNRMDLAYDKRTNHGETQGARW